MPKSRVKSYVRRGRLVQSFLRRSPLRKKKAQQEQPKKRRSKKVIAAGVAVGTGAALLGVSAGTYVALKKNYQAGFAKSAEWATNAAKDIPVAGVKPRQQHIAFTVGGMSYNDSAPGTASGDRLATSFRRAFSQKKGNDFKVIPIDNSDSNPTVNKVRPTSKVGEVKDAANYFLQNVKRGYNPTARNMAANVIAYADKYPDRPLIMVGHSSGGFVTHETQEILRRARPDLEKRLQTVNFGTEHYGMTERFGKSVTIASPNDIFTKNMPVRDGKFFTTVKGHNQSDYLLDSGVQGYVQRLIYGNQPAAVPAPKPKQAKQQKKPKQPKQPKPPKEANLSRNTENPMYLLSDFDGTAEFRKPRRDRGRKRGRRNETQYLSKPEFETMKYGTIAGLGAGTLLALRAYKKKIKPAKSVQTRKLKDLYTAGVASNTGHSPRFSAELRKSFNRENNSKKWEMVSEGALQGAAKGLLVSSTGLGIARISQQKKQRKRKRRGR